VDVHRVSPAGRGRLLSVRTIGFALGGALVALILIGQVIFLVNAQRAGLLNGSGGVVIAPRTGSLSHRLDVILNTVLGPSDRGVRRFRIDRIRSDAVHPRLRDIHLTFAINSDLSAGTVGNGAATDVYAMLRAIYTARLPIARVDLTGTYPLPDRSGRTRETTVMRLSMDRTTAEVVARTGWDSLDAETLWPLVTRSYVNREFQPVVSQ
jgi:hypothetical protein